MKRTSIFILTFAAAVLIGGCSQSSDNGGAAATTAPSTTATPATTPDTSAAPAAAPAGGAEVTNVALTDAPETKQSKDTFAPDTAKLWVEAELNGVKDGDKVQATFVADSAKSASGKDVSGSKISTDEKVFKEGMHGFEASLTKPTAGWAVGDYHVDILVNGDVKKTIKFKVAPAS